MVPTIDELIRAGWAYLYIAATACGLLIAWVILSCLLDRYVRLFHAPKPPCRIYSFKVRVLSAASMGKKVEL